MAKKVVRITRHEPQPKQVRELKRIFGDVNIETVSETLPTNPREFTERFDQIATNADVVEAVLPPTLLSAALRFSNFCKRGGVVVRAVMNRAVNNDGSVNFVFDHYERVLRVDIVTERL